MQYHGGLRLRTSNTIALTTEARVSDEDEGLEGDDENESPEPSSI